MLSKKNRLQNTSNFETAYKLGRRVSGKYGRMIIYRRKDEQPSRFGVVVSADKGDAVKRNRAKRQIRSVFSELKNKVGGGYDIFYIAWKLDFQFKQIKLEIERMLASEIPDYGNN